MTAPIIDPVIELAQTMDAAFAGRACQLLDQTGTPRPTALRRWTDAVDATDRALLLERCRGRTLDIGCGPVSTGKSSGSTRSSGSPAMTSFVVEDVARVGNRHAAVLRQVAT